MIISGRNRRELTICLDFLYAVRSDSSQILHINVELVDDELYFLLFQSRTYGFIDR